MADPIKVVRVRVPGPVSVATVRTGVRGPSGSGGSGGGLGPGLPTILDLYFRPQRWYVNNQRLEIGGVVFETKVSNTTRAAAGPLSALTAGSATCRILFSDGTNLTETWTAAQLAEAAGVDSNQTDWQSVIDLFNIFGWALPSGKTIVGGHIEITEAFASSATPAPSAASAIALIVQEYDQWQPNHYIDLPNYHHVIAERENTIGLTNGPTVAVPVYDVGAVPGYPDEPSTATGIDLSLQYTSSAPFAASGGAVVVVDLVAAVTSQEVAQAFAAAINAASGCAFSAGAATASGRIRCTAKAVGTANNNGVEAPDLWFEVKTVQLGTNATAPGLVQDDAVYFRSPRNVIDWDNGTKQIVRLEPGRYEYLDMINPRPGERCEVVLLQPSSGSLVSTFSARKLGELAGIMADGAGVPKEEASFSVQYAGLGGATSVFVTYFPRLGTRGAYKLSLGQVALPQAALDAVGGVPSLDSGRRINYSRLPVGTTANTVAAGNDSRFAGVNGTKTVYHFACRDPRWILNNDTLTVGGVTFEARVRNSTYKRGAGTLAGLTAGEARVKVTYSDATSSEAFLTYDNIVATAEAVAVGGMHRGVLHIGWEAPYFELSPGKTIVSAELQVLTQFVASGSPGPGSESMLELALLNSRSMDAGLYLSGDYQPLVAQVNTAMAGTATASGLSIVVGPLGDVPFGSVAAFRMSLIDVTSGTSFVPAGGAVVTVDLTSATTAEHVANALLAAINGSSACAFVAGSPNVGVLRLEAKTLGIAANTGVSGTMPGELTLVTYGEDDGPAGKLRANPPIYASRGGVIDWASGTRQSVRLRNGSQILLFANHPLGKTCALYLDQPASGAAGTVSNLSTVALSASNNARNAVLMDWQEDRSAYLFSKFA